MYSFDYQDEDREYKLLLEIKEKLCGIEKRLSHIESLPKRHTGEIVIEKKEARCEKCSKRGDQLKCPFVSTCMTGTKMILIDKATDDAVCSLFVAREET